MDEHEPIEKIESEEAELEPTTIGKTLKEIAANLGFRETDALKTIENDIVEAAQGGNEEKFSQLMTQFQILGEEITLGKTDREFAPARIGLMVQRAAILYRLNRTQDYSDEIYDALTEMDNLVALGYPDLGPTIEKLSDFYEDLKEAQRLAQFCRDNWNLSPDEASAVADSGDPNAAIATATLMLSEKNPDFDEGELIASLVEAGFLEG